MALVAEGKRELAERRVTFGEFHLFRIDGCDAAGKKLRMYTCYQMVNRHAMKMQKKL